MANIRDGLRSCNIRSWVELPRNAPTESHFVITEGKDLLDLCKWAAAPEHDFYLCTMTACDERMLEDNVFKLYTLLSGSGSQLVILEHPLDRNTTEYLSFRAAFPAVMPLEQAAKDLLGLTPTNALVEERFWLHAPFPPDLFPLRRNRTIGRLRAMIVGHRSQAKSVTPLPYGVLNLIAGPIHAGIIEAGQFCFHVAGEVVEDLEINLGYKHRGIEQLFETRYLLTTGQELAERGSGDSSFAHSLAYCQAVESLTRESLAPATLYWRGLLLEMERLYNHIGDVGALVHDVAFDLVASEIAVVRERMMRLNQILTGSRLLRGVNHPGGATIRFPERLPEVHNNIRQLTDAFLDLVGKQVIPNPGCRNRFLTTGVLTNAEVREIGATGLPARASGLWQQDFRRRHPTGIYALPDVGRELQLLVEGTILEPSVVARPSDSARQAPVFQSDLHGDAFARLLMRVAEVETSALIIEKLANYLKDLDLVEPLSLGKSFKQALEAADNFEVGLGCVEGWRGDIFYFVMKGPNNTIFRCQPRDPSLFNWPALRQAVIRKENQTQDNKGRARRRTFWENILADFPIINKSFNLSYAGHDG